MVKCSVYMCNSATYRNMPGITFHRFPRDKNLCDAWLKNSNLESWTPSAASVICSKHFEEHLFIKKASRTHLIKGAVPKIFEEFSESNECKENIPETSSKAVISRKRTATGDNVSVLWNIQYGSEQPSTSWQNPPAVQRLYKENMPETSSKADDVEVIPKKRTTTVENVCVYYGSNQPSTSWQNPPVIQQHCKENIPETSSKAVMSRKRTATGENVLRNIQYGREQPSTSWQNAPAVQRHCKEISPETSSKAEDVEVIPKKRAVSEKNVSILQEIQYGSQLLCISSHSSPAEVQQRVSDPLTMTNKSRPFSPTTTIKKLQSKIVFKNKQIKALREKQRRLNKKVATFSEIINYLKTKLNSEDVHVLNNIPGNNNKDFLIRYFKKVTGSTVEKCYSPELRSFALQLNFFSPRAYNFVRQSFNTVLPHPVTISRWYKKVDAKPGFTAESFNILDALSKKHKHKIFVNLVLDEMAIRKELVWDGSKFQGRVDTGTEVSDDSLPLATQALVLMVTAINCGWKLPIAFFFITAMNAEQRANVVRIALQMLYDIKIFVKGITFDGAASNISMATQLGCNFSLNNLQPFFTFQNDHIFWDPCHMVKLIRNTLGDFKDIIDKDGNVVAFKYLQLLLELQESKGLYLANKLRQAHIFFSNQKMKVRLATQLFSKSVADALNYCKDELGLNEFQQSSATATFVNLINDAFDILNSRSMFSPGFKKALCPANIARTITFVKMFKEYICNLKFLNNNLVVMSGRKTGFLGFVISLESSMNMFHDLVIVEKLRFFPCYKISQDHLEMFFGMMRRRGGFNDNPNTVNFQIAYKKNLVRTEINLNKDGDLTDDIPILKVSSSKNPTTFLNDSTPSYEQNEYSDFLDEDDIQCFIDNIEDNPLDEYTNQVTIYIAGFVTRKVLKNIKCCVCQSLTIGEKKNFFFSLIQRKDRGGLTYPSAGVVSVVQECEKMF